MENLFDIEFDRKCHENFYFRVKGTKSTYKMFTQQGICIVGQARTNSWSYQDVTDNWEQRVVSNSLFPQKVYRCLSVWWLDPNIEIQNVPSGVFFVYLRHGGNHVSGAVCKFYIKDSATSDYQIGETNPFFYKRDLLNQNNGKLLNTYVATLDLSDFGEQLVNLKILIFSNQHTSNYLIEGVILVPKSDVEQNPLYTFPLQKDEGLTLDNEEIKNQQVITVITKENQQSQKEDEIKEVPKVSNSKQASQHQNYNYGSEEDSGNEEEDDESFDEYEIQTYQMLEELFEKYDTNGSGSIEENEFKKMMRDITSKFSMEYDVQNVQQLFKRHDINNDGTVSQGELKKLARQIVQLDEQRRLQQEEQKHDQEKVDSFIENIEDLEFIDIAQCEIRAETSGTTHESYENLIVNDEDDEAGSKWCVTGTNNGMVFLSFDEEIEFNYIGLKSANDEPKRDPTGLELRRLADDDDEEGEILLKLERIQFNDRFEKKVYKVSGENVRGKFFTVKIQNGYKEIQLAQILFYKNKV